MNIRETAQQVHQNAKNKGFWDKPREFGTMLMLITSELGEALDADRESKHADIESFEKRLEEMNRSINTSDPKEREKIELENFVSLFKARIKDTVGDEMADAVIRIFDTTEGNSIDIQKHIELKKRFNETREKLHGKSY